MWDTVTNKPRLRPCRRAAAPAAWLMMALSALVVLPCAGARNARAQEILRWKFSAGDVLKYTTEQTTMMTVKVMGRERKQKRAQTTTYTWSVKGVSATGDADIVQRIDRLTMKVEAPPYMPFEFDSSSPKGAVPEPFEAEVKQLKAAIGAEFSFKMKPSGEIESIKIPEATLKKLREGLPADEGEQGALSEQALKDMVSQSSPPPFPQVPLEAGKSWSSKPNRIPLPLGTLVLERTFTFQGPDPVNPKLMKIAMEGRVALEPAQNVTAKIRLQDGKGSISFDNESGRLVSSRGTQKTEMVIANQGQEIDQTTDTNSVMTLLP
jgi:Family of unknown function (DUF6263)